MSLLADQIVPRTQASLAHLRARLAPLLLKVSSEDAAGAESARTLSDLGWRLSAWVANARAALADVIALSQTARDSGAGEEPLPGPASEGPIVRGPEQGSHGKQELRSGVALSPEGSLSAGPRIPAPRTRFDQPSPASAERPGEANAAVLAGRIARYADLLSSAVEGFTRRYRVHRLVWYALLDGMDEAIALEKRLKGWRRAWKLRIMVVLSSFRRRPGSRAWKLSCHFTPCASPR